MTLIKLHEKIWYYEGCLVNPDKLIEMIESDELEWKDWVVQEGSLFYQFGQQKIYKDKDDIVYQIINKALYTRGSEYLKHFNLKSNDISELTISKYYEGKQMGAHVDSYNEDVDKALISSIVYLNDTYQGGELFFPNQNVTVKPIAGSILIFPSTEPFVHQSLKVEKGNKYIAAMFWVKNEK